MSGGASPIVRVPASEPWMMKRALDSGTHAVMIPMCETPVSISLLSSGDFCEYLVAHSI